jgi:hypothetical protein
MDPLCLCSGVRWLLVCPSPAYILYTIRVVVFELVVLLLSRCHSFLFVVISFFSVLVYKSPFLVEPAPPLFFEYHDGS